MRKANSASITRCTKSLAGNVDPDGRCCATGAGRTTGRRSRAPPGRSGSCTPPCTRCGAHPRASTRRRHAAGSRRRRRDSSVSAGRADRPRPCAVARMSSSSSAAADRDRVSRGSALFSRPRPHGRSVRSSPDAATQRRPTQVGDPRRRRAGHHRRRVHRDDRRRRGQGRRASRPPWCTTTSRRRSTSSPPPSGSPATTTSSFATRLPRAPVRVVHRLDRVLCGSLPSDASDGSWLLWIETWGETRRLPPLREAMAELTEHEIEVIHRLFAEGATARRVRLRRPGARRGAACRRCATVSPSSRRCSAAARRPMCSSTSFAAASATSSGCRAPSTTACSRSASEDRPRRPERGARTAARLSAGAVWSFGTVLARVADESNAFQYLIWRSLGIIAVVEAVGARHRAAAEHAARLHVRPSHDGRQRGFAAGLDRLRLRRQDDLAGQRRLPRARRRRCSASSSPACSSASESRAARTWPFRSRSSDWRSWWSATSTSTAPARTSWVTWRRWPPPPASRSTPRSCARGRPRLDAGSPRLRGADDPDLRRRDLRRR